MSCNCENRPLTYLASPYSNKGPAEKKTQVENERFNAAVRAACYLMNKDRWNVFSPIVHSHPLARLGLPGDWAFWKRIDTDFIGVSARLVVLCIEGWDKSTGVTEELAIAREQTIPVYYLVPNGLDYNLQIEPPCHE